MIASDTHRMLFVHVQKTGGVTIEEVLDDQLGDARMVLGIPGARHATLGALLEARPRYAEYWSFGFVRNPWARIHSWFGMIQRRGRTAERKGTPEIVDINPLWRTVLADYNSFEAFVLEAPAQFEQLRRPQLDYLVAPGRQVDFIGRSEHLERDLGVVLSHAGLDPVAGLPHRNRGPRPKQPLADPRDVYRGSFTPQMRDRVATAFAADIDEFGYEF